MAYPLSERAPRASNFTAKNRVWGFFENSNRTRPVNRRQPQQPRRKNRLTPTKTASGIPYWPSRDPIQERGGVNLYGFCYNSPYDWFDVLGHEPKSQSNDKRRQASVDNSNGKNSNKTIETAQKANSGSATFDPNTSPSNGRTAAIDAIGLVQDWAGDINGLLGIKAKEKACSELAKKRKNELGWTSCKACCVVAFTAPRETGHRALTNRIIRDDISYHHFNVYEGECVYGDGGTADQMKKDLGPEKANMEYMYATGNEKLRYSLNDIEL
jgi:hypothetical protein